MGRKKKNSKTTQKHKEIKSIFMISFGILCIFSLHTNSVGTLGIFINNFLKGLLSKPAYLFPYLIIAIGILSLNNIFEKYKKKFIIISISLYFSFIVFYALYFKDYIPEVIMQTSSLKIVYYFGIDGFGGGIIGSILASIFIYFFGIQGSYIVLTTLIIALLILTTNITLSKILIKLYKGLSKSLNYIKESFISLIKDKQLDEINITEPEPILDSNKLDDKIKILDYTNIKEKSKEKNVNNTTKGIDNNNEITINKEEKNNDTIININNNTLKDYKLPDINLLNTNENNLTRNNNKDILLKAKLLEKTLKNFGVRAKVVQISKGPTITRFEVQPDSGVKVSKIVNLTDDIALNLAAQNIRIEAPIPGKSAVGIEVPNDESMIVPLREVLESPSFTENESKLTFALGKNISGNPIVADLAKMPHMLIAGATGSGKSVCVNSLITSILYKSTPDEVKFLLIDPKVVELNNYNGIPHLVLPVVTDPKKASTALNWVVQEMTNRYKLFAQNGVRDIDGYNKKYNDATEKLPKLVVIIDELADLMMVAPNQVEDAICRLAQMARAAGIHLIVATQRPSVDVITGIIKANIPSRISFAVSSQTDSRTILDMGGAEKLLGRGDMLFYPVGASKPIRVQGAYISDEEVKSVVEYIKSQVGEVNYKDDIIESMGNQNEENNTDELLPKAIELVIDAEQASISMLQRKLRIGYNRAARLIDEMEKMGIISEHLGSKPRNVLITKEQYNEINNNAN